MPFILSIDKVEPAILVQGRPVQISFSLTNNSGSATSGTVSSDFGGEAPIANLADGTTVSGSLSFAAPKAKQNAGIVVQFFETNAPIVGEFRQSSADATISVNIGTGYILEVSSLFGTFTNPPFPHDPSSQTWTADLFNNKTFPQNPTPVWEWTPLLDQHDEFDTKLVGISGTAIYKESGPLSSSDNPFLHPFGFDYEFFIAPDPQYVSLLAPNNLSTGPALDGEFKQAIGKANDPNGLNLGVPGVLGIEVEQKLVPSSYRAQDTDRVAVFGRWIVDDGEPDFHTEIHPPLLLASAKALSQNATHSTVIGRPYLVSQEFDDGAMFQHFINELEKILPIAPPTTTGGIPITRSNKIEAHPNLKEKPFSGIQIMTYVVRPQSPRNNPGDVLQVQYRFIVRTGVTVQLINDTTEDAVKVSIVMNDTTYTPLPPPPRQDKDYSISDLEALKHGLGETINTVIRDIAIAGVLGGALIGDPIDATITAGVVDKALANGIGTHFYDAPAVGMHDPEPITVTVDKLSGGPHFSVDDGQPYPIYGQLTVQWTTRTLMTDVAPAAAAAGNYVFFFAKHPDGRIFYNRAKLGQGLEGWIEVGGGGRTNASPSAAAIGTYMFIAVRGLDGNIYINQTGDLGKSFVGWHSANFSTDVAPAVAAAGDYVFFFAKHPDGRIFYNRAKLGQGLEGWIEVGGGGRTNASPAAAAVGTYMFVAIKGLDGNIYINQTGDLGQTFLTWDLLK